MSEIDKIEKNIQGNEEIIKRITNGVSFSDLDKKSISPKRV